MNDKSKLTYYPWYEGATEFVEFLGVKLWKQTAKPLEVGHDPHAHLDEGTQIGLILMREQFNDDFTKKTDEEIAAVYEKERLELEKENKPTLAGWLRQLIIDEEVEAPSWVKQTSVPGNAKQLGFKVTTRKEGDKLYVTRNN